ncbi:MAG: O-antigen ligase family protein [Planctomycetota bacterium]
MNLIDKFDVSSMVLVSGLVAVVIAHLALVVANHYLNPVAVLAGAFAVLAPMSVATLLPGLIAFKLMRVYVIVLGVMLGLYWLKRSRLGLLAWLWLSFGTLYWLSGAWSTSPVLALRYKWQFLIGLAFGILAVNTSFARGEFYQFTRCLLLSLIAVCLFLLADMVSNPDAFLHIGRLAAWGMNPNRIGQSLAPLAIIALYIALQDPRHAIRLIGIGATVAATILLLYTGSRGALAMFVLGAAVLIAPRVANPMRFIAALIVAAGIVGLALYLAEGAGTQRLTTFESANRAQPWGDAMAAFSASPIVGQGWVSTNPGTGIQSTNNAHSIYLQTLAEVGVIGLTVLIAVVGLTLSRLYVHVKTYGVANLSKSPAILGYALTLSLLAHGAFESATLLGTVIGTVILGIGVGTIDLYTPTRAKARQWAAAHQQAAYPAPA